MSEKKEDAKVKEGKAVDQDGNEVKVDILDSEDKPIKEGKAKKSWKDRLILAGKIGLGVVATLGAGIVGAKVGGDKVKKAKDEEIRKLQNDNYELSEELEAAYAANRKEASDEDVEVTNF